MKRRLVVALLFLTMSLAFASCKKPEAAVEEVAVEEETEMEEEMAETEELADPEVPEATEAPETTEVPEATEAAEPAAPADMGIDAEDAVLYNTKENAVPLGQWVYYQAKNYTSGEYEPYYLRVIKVSRDEAEVQAAIDAYSGIMDFSLTEDQARDIEYGIVEYEIYFAPDYAAEEYGITIPSTSLGATAIESAGFKTDGGMSYIGVGRAHNLNVNGSSYHPQPGDTVHEKGLFSILKNYDESEYVFHITWYDGEIVSGKEQELYFAATQ